VTHTHHNNRPWRRRSGGGTTASGKGAGSTIGRVPFDYLTIIAHNHAPRVRRLLSIKASPLLTLRKNTSLESRTDKAAVRPNANNGGHSRPTPPLSLGFCAPTSTAMFVLWPARIPGVKRRAVLTAPAPVLATNGSWDLPPPRKRSRTGHACEEATVCTNLGSTCFAVAPLRGGSPRPCQGRGRSGRPATLEWLDDRARPRADLLSA